MTQVPFRICFQPFDSPLDTAAVTEWLVDILVLLHILIKFNTAYINKSSLMVHKRSKVAKHYLLYVACVDFDVVHMACMPTWHPFTHLCTLLACHVHVQNRGSFFLDLCETFPFTLSAYALGATPTVTDWLRLPKILRARHLLVTILAPIKSNAVFPVARAIARLWLILVMVVHILSCVWFSIGNIPGQDRTWYKRNYPSGLVTGMCQTLECTKDELDARVQYGMQEDSTSFAAYLLSLDWIFATVSTNGLIGRLVPTNNLELLFVNLVMVVNVTLILYIIGTSLECSVLMMRCTTCFDR